MADFQDYYEILQVSPSAEPEVIKAAYLKLSQKYHPDHNSNDPLAKDRMQQINKAFDALSDPIKRKKHDLDRQQNKGYGPSSSEKKQTSSKPKPMVKPSHISFNDMEPGQIKKSSFIIDNIGGPYSTLNVSNSSSWLKITKQHSLTTLKELPQEVEIEVTGSADITSNIEYLRIELDDIKTNVTVEVRMKPKPTPKPAEPKQYSTYSNQGQPTKIPRWAIGIVIVLLLGVARWASNQTSSVSNNTPAVTTASVTPDTAQAHITKGDGYSKQNQWANAIIEYTKAIEIDPTLIDAYTGRGFAYVMQNENNQALSDYNKAIEINPNSAYVYVSRGYTFWEMGDLDQAEADYSKAIIISPQYSAAYYWRGLAYYKTSEYDKAIADYNQAIKIDPTDGYTYTWRGDAYKAKGQYDEAIADYTKGIEINPKEDYWYILRGNAYYANGSFDQAITDYTKGIEINPNYAYAYIYRGNSYIMYSEYDSAVADYTEAINLNPNLAEAYASRAAAYEKKGQGDKATADFNMAKELENNQNTY